MAFCGYLKQSTAATIMLGPFVDEDDGKTAETGLTISQADVRLSKNGGNMAQKNDANAAAHDEIGKYSCQLDATDTGTLGILDVMVHESGALPVHQSYQVVTANWYDTMCSTDQLDVNVTNIEGSDATDQIRDAVVDDSTRIDASALNTLSGHAPASTIAAQSDVTGLNDPDAAAIADAVWDEDIVAAHNTADTAGALLDDLGTPNDFKADVSGLATAANLQTVDDNVDAILLDTNELQTDDVPGLIAALNDLSAAEVNAEVDTALADIHLDHLLAADYDPASKPGVATALLNELVENDGGVSRFTANALEEAPTGGSAPTAAEIADAVWDEAKAGHVGAGSFGEEMQAHALSSEVAALNDLSAAEVNAEVDTALADYDPPTKAELDSGLAGLNDPAAAAIADAVWDEAKADHVGVGSFGEEVQAHSLSSEISALNDLSAAQVNAEVDTALADYDPPTKAELDSGLAALNDPDAAAIADAVWDEDVVAAHNGADTAGALLDDLGTPGDFKADVSALATAANLQTVDDNVDAILADTNELQTDDVPGLIAALNDLSAAEVNAEVVDALTVDVIADSVSADGIRPTIAQALLEINRFLQERSVSGTTVTVTKEDGSTSVMTFTLDDGTSPTSITRAS